jgi:hypothetical protein
MLYFYMLVSNNSLLNILLPNDNKVLKDVLKEADSKTLDQMIKNKSVNVNDVLKSLFEDLKTGTKSNATIENILKNSTIFKELGSFSKSISSMIENIDKDVNLQKFKPLLENFLKNIKDLDANNLKEQLNKSGVFLESKIAQSANQNNTLNTSVKNLLNEIQNLIKNIDTPQSKQINELINKVLQNPNSSETITNLKTLTSSLQNLNSNLNTPQTQNLSNLTNQLKSIISDATLIESKIQNNPINTNTTSNVNPNLKEQINIQTKELLTQIKSEIIQNPSLQNKNILSLIDNLLKSNDLFSKDTKLIEPKVLLNNLINSSEIKTLSSTNPNISNTVLNLKNIVENITTLESKTLNMQNITNDKNSLLNNLKENLTALKSELLNIKTIDTTNINQIISKLDNLQTLFTKVEIPNATLLQNLQNTNLSTFSNTFSTNLNTLLLSLKENIVNLTPNQENLNLQNSVLKTIDKIETIIKDSIVNPNILKNESANVSNDMKSILLQMQDELSSKTDTKSLDVLKQVDRLLTQIDYQQLTSLTSNSNYVYLPFFWDMLENGTIDIKKTQEDKFYCQINLTLKDFGKVDLMLGLYDKNKLDLTIYAQREHFKIALRDNLQKLKQSLNNVDLIPVNIKLLDMQEEINEQDKPTQVYKNNNNPYNQNFDLGLDIRA